jgi:hypothetical protein
MNTATVDRGLYAVDSPTTTQERLGLLLRLRRAGRQALDLLLALPRGAAGWVIRHTHGLLHVLGQHPTLARLGARIGDLAGLVRTAGPVATVTAIISVPALWRAALRGARYLSSRAAAGAQTVWRWTSTLLRKAGPTGARVATGLSSAGHTASAILATLATHPVTRAAGRGIAALARLARPISQSLVAHRLLAQLVTPAWLRVALETLTLPLIVAPGLGGTLTRHLRPVTAPRVHTSGARICLPDNETGPVQQDTSSRSTDDGSTGQDGTTDEVAALLEPQNRAERRAQQQAQVHAKRARARR